MAAEIETFSPDLVISQLRKSKVVDSSQNPDLQPLPRNPGRRDHATRQAFRVWAAQKTVCYLLVGPDLSGIWERARAFAEACPDIAAKPLFLQQTPKVDVLGLEFIEGSVFDGTEGSLAGSEAMPAAVLAALERTMKPSSMADLNAELERFFAWVTACPVFGAIDGGFLRDAIFPWVREGACRQPTQTRWTNGDFTAHNIIVDRQGKPRLIDYEYAHRTHFYLEDFVRWRTYSKVSEHAFDARLGQIPPWLEAFFLLRQIVLEHEIAIPRISGEGVEERVSRLHQLAAEAHLQFRTTYFLKPLTREAEWQRLQQQVRHLDGEVVRRGEWIRTLEQKLAATEKRLAELTALETGFQDRIARTEGNFHNLEEQMVQAQSLTARLMADLEEKVRQSAALEKTIEDERQEQARLRLQGSDLEDKIARMQNSISWRMTSLFRAFRRLFLDRK